MYSIYKAYKVYRYVLGLHIHSLLTHPEQLQVLQAPFMISVLYRSTLFLKKKVFYTLFLLYFFCI